MSNIIETKNLTRRFRKTEAVNDLNLFVEEGSIFAFLGPNGAGKTTTIKTIMNLLEPSSGTATILGVDSKKLSPKEFSQIGYVSENQELPEWMTVQQFINFCKPLYSTWDDSFCNHLLKQFQLPIDQKLKNLSRGNKMKASLLSSLAYRPRLLVLDEPFTGLDPLVRDEFISGILELTQQEKWTIFISSHDIDEVERLADWVGILDCGRLKLSESTNSLQNRFRQISARLSEPYNKTSPISWLGIETSDQAIRFVETNFKTEEIIREQLGSAEISVTPMSLREIFLALARTYRISK
jgi:ABC-2 type transport system ATP-binding protein